MAKTSKSKPVNVQDVVSQLHFNQDVMNMFAEVLERIENLEKIAGVQEYTMLKESN